MANEIIREVKDHEDRLTRLESLDRSAKQYGTSFPTDGLYHGRPFYLTSQGAGTIGAWYYYSTTDFSGPAAGWYRADIGHSDNFTRADSATTMGSTADNYAWNAIQGIGANLWGINSNQAYSVTNTDGRLVFLDSYQMTNPTIQCQVSGTLNASYLLPDIAFRGLDPNNYLEVQLFGGQVYLEKWDAGVNTNLINAAQTTTDGVTYTITIVCKGLLVTVYVNGISKITHTLAVPDVKYAGYTKMGFLLKKSGAPATAARWDNLIVRQAA